MESIVFRPKSKSASNVIIPDGFTAIGEEAFKDCTNLTSVVIPNSVKKIGGGSIFGVHQSYQHRHSE